MGKLNYIMATLLFLCLLKMPYEYYELVRFLGMIYFFIQGQNSLKKEEKYEFNDNKKSSLSDAINKEIPTFKEYERILKDNNKEVKLSEKEFNKLSLQEKETLIWQAKNCK